MTEPSPCFTDSCRRSLHIYNILKQNFQISISHSIQPVATDFRFSVTGNTSMAFHFCWSFSEGWMNQLRGQWNECVRKKWSKGWFSTLKWSSTRTELKFMKLVKMQRRKTDLQRHIVQESLTRWRWNIKKWGPAQCFYTTSVCKKETNKINMHINIHKNR